MLDRVQRSMPIEVIDSNNNSGYKPRLIEKIHTVNTRLTQYIVLMPALRTRANRLLERPSNESSAEEVTEFIRECKVFDAMLASWPSTVPEDWQYFTISKQRDVPLNGNYEHLELYPGHVDIYYDGWVACVWNSWRCTRMFVNAMILRCVV